MPDYYGRSRKDPNSIYLAEPVHAEGRSVCLASAPVALKNGDAIGTRVYLGKVGSGWIIKPSSTIYHEALGVGAKLDVGFEKDGSKQINGGDKSATLGNDLDVSAAGTKSGVAAVTTANLGKRVYELLGYARDPGVEFDIVGTVVSGAIAADGNVSAFFDCLKK